jgi:predicted metalloprotease with PDZ domain
MQEPETKIQYDITPLKPEAHLFEIRLSIENPSREGQILWLPAWIPGSYMIRDFAKNIVSFTASSNDQQIAFKKVDKQTWQCAPCEGMLSVTYTVYAWDMSVRTAHLDTTHAFFNGSSVYLAVKGREHQPVSINIHLPPGSHYSDWRVATTLSNRNTGLFEPGIYFANNYEDLIDHPVEMGNFTESSFNIDGTPHHIVITGRQQADLARLTGDVEKICRTHVNMFGNLPEMDRYVFLLTVVGDGYGGLEHRSSTALICSRKDLPGKNMRQVSDDYINLLGLFSHEYFHTWNVKRIKPASFIPYQLESESYTELLWAFEGITSYYDELGLIRSQVIEEKNYLELLGKNITRVLRGSGRLRQTLRESSFEAWSKFYKQDENAPNSIVSYYVKGGLFALCLDLKIRDITEHEKSLDDVMRLLWKEHGEPHIGVEEDTIPNVASRVANQPLNDFFDKYLSTTRDLPLAELLATMGTELRQRTTPSYDDPGGKPARDEEPIGFRLGAKFVSDPLGVKIQLIYDDGCLQDAGLAVGDVLIAIDGLQVKTENLTSLLAAYSAGDSARFTAFRRDELMEFQVILSSAVEDTFYLVITEKECDKRNSWLHLKN